jgi:hypothetical protein
MTPRGEQVSSKRKSAAPKFRKNALREREKKRRRAPGINPAALAINSNAYLYRLMSKRASASQPRRLYLLAAMLLHPDAG